MKVKARWSTPMLHAQSIENSIRFYQSLGFEISDTDRSRPLGWARIECEGGALMFLRAEHPRKPTDTPLMLVLYTPDLPALRAQLIEEKMPVGEITHPDYMPSGELMLKDPDGNIVLVNHWSKAENDAWLERIKETPKTL